jgi:putative membrane protein
METEINPDFVPEEKKKEKDKEKKEKVKKDELTIERAWLAQERTMLASIRTATTFMTFGFALFKFLEAQLMQPHHHPWLAWITPQMIGLAMLGTGLFGLVVSVIRHFQVMKRLSTFTERKFFTPVLIQAYVVSLLIILLLTAVLFR